MGEIKSVKVDNWGVFFLQKLQNFFNKTDYCDLTLQFRDNSQLKVHRLVLSACTDYFNVLEQTCEVIDDALIMPNELQADVVVPIVNFMYTGTLEFELKMYGKLLRTAKEMNMTVLLKLLEAHRRTMENVNKSQRPPSPKAIRRRVPAAAQQGQQYQNQGQQTRIGGGVGLHTVGGVGGGNIQKRIVQTKAVGTNMAPGLQVFRQQIGSTSVTRTLAAKQNLQQQQQTSIQTYIKSEPDEYETLATTQQSTSPFEQLRKGYNNNKRPAVTAFTSPPSKKPNLEDVKEFAEQQRMRKQIAAEYGEDQEFEGMMDDDIHNDDDDDEGGNAAAMQQQQATVNATANVTSPGGVATGGNNEVVRNTSITFKHESDGQPPTIIVKDSSGSKLNHAKIISEVLRQYPHLAKGNKNIKLKIMPNASGQPQQQRIVVKKEPEIQQAAATQETLTQQQQQQLVKPTQQQKVNFPTQILSSSQVTIRAGDRVISQGGQQQQQVTATSNKAAIQQKPNIASSNVSAPVIDNSQQKRRIDSKTMHALIALGAENMTGPWLCLRCGVNGRPISIPSYRGFRRHLINTHKESIDPALCEHCGWRSRTNRELHFHMQTEHKIKTALYTFPECVLCVELFLDTSALNQHMLDSHPSANKQQCIYCNKIFIKEIQLYTHMKLYHKHQALEDGIIDASDEEFGGIGDGDEEDEDGDGDGGDTENMNMDTDSDRGGGDMPSVTATIAAAMERRDGKVKILSDISLPIAATSSVIKLENENENKTTRRNVVLPQSTKFVTADGSEMILTDEQRKEIISQLNQNENNGGVVMVLQETLDPSSDDTIVNAAAATTTSAAEAQEAETATAATSSIVSEEEDEEMIENQQVFDSRRRLTSAASSTTQNKNKSGNKEAMDMEWAENLISEHDSADNGNDKKMATTISNKKGNEHGEEANKPKNDDISQKLKELTGDWSEDENEDDGDGDGVVEKLDDSTDDPLAAADDDDDDDEKAMPNQADVEEELKQIENELKDSVDNGDADQICSTKHGKNNKKEEEKEKNLIETPTPSKTAEENTEETKKVENEPDKKKDNVDNAGGRGRGGDDDDIDLAMQNIHEGDNIKIELNTSNEKLPPPSSPSTTKEHLIMDVDDIKKEDLCKENSKISIAATASSTAAAAAEDENKELLDELIARTENSSLDDAAAAAAAQQKNKIIDDFDEADIKDVEEFTSLDKNDEQQSTTTTTFISIVKEPPKVKSINETESQSNEETKKKIDEKSSTKTTETASASQVAKTLTSDWDDIDDDDYDDVDDDEDDLDEVVGNVAE